MTAGNALGGEDSQSASWTSSAGLGVVSAPRSIGSGRQLTIPVPYVEARYGGWFFATDNPYEGVGVTKKLGSGWRVTASVGVDLDVRDPAQDSRIRGLHKVSAAGALRGRAEYEGDRWFSSLTLADRLAAGNSRGATLTGELGFNALITDRLLGAIGVTARVIDRTWADSFLSVTAAESSRSGLAIHAGTAGMLDEGGFFQAVYRIDGRWTFFSRLQYTRFDANAVTSPVISNRGSPIGVLFFTRAF